MEGEVQQQAKEINQVFTIKMNLSLSNCSSIGHHDVESLLQSIKSLCKLFQWQKQRHIEYFKPPIRLTDSMTGDIGYIFQSLSRSKESQKNSQQSKSNIDSRDLSQKMEGLQNKISDINKQLDSLKGNYQRLEQQRKQEKSDSLLVEDSSFEERIKQSKKFKQMEARLEQLNAKLSQLPNQNSIQLPNQNSIQLPNQNSNQSIHVYRYDQSSFKKAKDNYLTIQQNLNAKERSSFLKESSSFQNTSKMEGLGGSSSRKRSTSKNNILQEISFANDQNSGMSSRSRNGGPRLMSANGRRRLAYNLSRVNMGME